MLKTLHTICRVGIASEPPPASDDAGRKLWLRKRWEARQISEANRFREALIQWYGPDQGKAVKYAEAFEICEYGRQPNADELRKLFPFFPPH